MGGNLFIYSTEDHMNILGTIQDPLKNTIDYLYLERNKKYLFGGSRQGWLIIFEIRNSGEERFSAIAGSIETLKNVKSLCYSTKKEVYLTNNTGNVVFFNIQTGTSFYVLEAHKADINKLLYLEDKCVMITASKDKTIKFWKYPLPTEEVPDFTPNPEYNLPKKPSTAVKIDKKEETIIKDKKEEETKTDKAKEEADKKNEPEIESPTEGDKETLGGWDQ